ncbi:hypothetical protein EYF80_052996 [Liparis tanakae]|uniref:Uncharacterized protein n=1 Tax=Liparis tanakae TaxID=230148 RepID=A0A4Z2F7Q8_9TELE|nr:hypothetical protein EYF80_052996 [Liparis tanakae]
MALVTVQRSPTPSTTSSPSVSESGSGEDDRRSQPRSFIKDQDVSAVIVHPLPRIPLGFHLSASWIPVAEREPSQSLHPKEKAALAPTGPESLGGEREDEGSHL